MSPHPIFLPTHPLSVPSSSVGYLPAGLASYLQHLVFSLTFFSRSSHFSSALVATRNVLSYVCTYHISTYSLSQLLIVTPNRLANSHSSPPSVHPFILTPHPQHRYSPFQHSPLHASFTLPRCHLVFHSQISVETSL